MNTTTIIATSCHEKSAHHDKLQTIIAHCNYDILINTEDRAYEHFSTKDVNVHSYKDWTSNTVCRLPGINVVIYPGDMDEAARDRYLSGSDIVVCSKHNPDCSSVNVTDQCVYVCGVQRDNINDLVYVCITLAQQDDGEYAMTFEFSHHYVDFIADRYSK